MPPWMLMGHSYYLILIQFILFQYLFWEDIEDIKAKLQALKSIGHIEVFKNET